MNKDERLSQRDLQKAIGINIQRYRKEQKWTQAELSERTGISHIGAVERGECNISLKTMLALANVFSITLEELIRADKASKTSIS